MTALRESAIRELERLPEEKLMYIIQIMQGVNNSSDMSLKYEREEAFLRLEQLRKKCAIDDYKSELASYREEKYGK